GLDCPVETGLALGFNCHNGVASPSHPRCVRRKTHGEVRLWWTNGKPVTEVVAAALEQVANPDDILTRFAELPFDPHVGADVVVVLLDHGSLGVGQGQYRVQRRTKAAGFD